MSVEPVSSKRANVPTDWSRYLLGACSSGDALRPAVVRNHAQVVELRAEVERLRGDVREWERQFAGLGVAAGRGEPLDTAAAVEQSRELLDQAACPHTDSSWDEDEWSCWDCGAYCNHARAGDRAFECAPSHARLKARPL